ncbi:DUF2961 domain-containing protein [bacterium]|nr:DUF2961 domain-containing protein [bacterium]
MQRKITLALLAALLVIPTAARSVLDTDLSNLWELRDFAVDRISSTAADGSNHDWKTIPPGETLVLADLPGPGMIHHIWVTIASDDPMHLKNIVLRMYWDGETVPSVQAPIGDFFGLGHGQVYFVNSAPIQVGSFKGMNCFWPMPYRKRALVTAENQGSVECRSFYYYVDYRKKVKLPKKVATFHAWYNQAYPADRQTDYVIMEAVGKGHYVGTNLSVQLNTPGWWGEGDDKIYIDGSPAPSMKGTGSEDYFCGAWCYRDAFTFPYFGAPLLKAGDLHAREALWNVYRYHILDPITFEKDIKVHIETGAWPGTNDRRPFTNNYSSVGYWYQTEPHQAFPPLPSAPERIGKVIAWETDPVAPVKEGEMMPVRAKSAEGVEIAPQSLGNVRWSMNTQQWLKFTAPGQWAELEFRMDKAGPRNVTLVITNAADYGIAKVSINGRVLESNVDCYRPEGIAARRVALGQVELLEGANTLRIEVVGKNPASSGYLLGVDCVRVE